MAPPAKNQFTDDDARHRLVEMLRLAGHLLNDRQRDLLQRRAGLIDGHYHTYADLARHFGVTTARVRQIQNAALAKLQQPGSGVRADEVSYLREIDLEPERPGVIGEVIPLVRPGAALTLAQARTVLLERYARTGDRLRQLLASWLATVDSPNTRDAYLRDISQYLDYCIERDLDPLGVRIQDFNLYREHLARHTKTGGTPYARSTRNRKIASVSSFYRHLVDVDAVDRNPVTSKARFNDKQQPPNKALTIEETSILFEDAASGHLTLGPLTAALVVHLLFTMGLRVSEVCNLDLDQLSYVERDGVRYRGITFIGKGNKKHERGIPRQLDNALLTPYLDQRPQPASGEDSMALLLTLDGRRLNRKQLYRLVQRVHRRGLLPHKVTPHWGRHTFNLRAEEAGFSLEQRQRALDHASAVTTQGYGQARNNVLNDPSHAIATILHAHTTTHTTTQHDADTHPSSEEANYDQQRRPA